MDSLLYALTRALLVLFAVGAVGCLLVIPVTAIELFKVLFETGTDEEPMPPPTPPVDPNTTMQIQI